MAEAVKYLYIENILTSVGSCTNVLSFTEEHIMEITPQFVPNTFQGVDVKQDHKWWVLTFVIDSETNIFDGAFAVTAANTPFITTFYVDFILADGTATRERWTYTAERAWVINRNEGKTDMDAERNLTEYQILIYGTRVITRPP
jgi:hypothetical protein